MLARPANRIVLTDGLRKAASARGARPVLSPAVRRQRAFHDHGDPGCRELHPRPENRSPAYSASGIIAGGKSTARRVPTRGTPVELPPPTGRRDGSGERITQPLSAISGSAPPA